MTREEKIKINRDELKIMAKMIQYRPEKYRVVWITKKGLSNCDRTFAKFQEYDEKYKEWKWKECMMLSLPKREYDQTIKKQMDMRGLKHKSCRR